MDILVVGPWGSGTTAMAQCLDAAGLAFPGPHFRTSDPRTPNSWENRQFRDAIMPSVDEKNLRIESGAHEQLSSRLRNCRQQLSSQCPYGIKLPAAAFFLETIESVFADTLRLIIVVDRSDDAIEATRKRRDWRACYGMRGAAAIRIAIAAARCNLKLPVLDVQFSDLLASPEAVATQVSYLSGLVLSISQAGSPIREE